ncbi:MAG TPA: HRDC domain-containing protein, partial [Oligoflexia bacterium]|nr:HRDC domain-containing protein [Oligoflexia bacterium]
EQRARAVNVPRRRIVDDDVLIDLSRTRPQDLEHLQAFRGLNKGEFRTSGDAILQAIARGLANAQAGRAVPPIRQEPASDGEARVLELVICMARAIADQNAISLKHLMSADWALEIIRARPRTVDELAALNLLSQGAVELLGRQLTDLLEGRLSLSIRDGAVEIFRVRS